MVLIQLLLPAGVGGDLDTKALTETRRELVDQFKGVTAYVRSPARGVWIGPDGATEADDVVMVEVVTDTFDRTWWRTYSATLADRFCAGHDPRAGVAPPDAGRRGEMSRPLAAAVGAVA